MVRICKEGIWQMESKNFTEVMIGGKVYTLAGFEEENYLQRVAAYINGKIGELKRQDGFLRQSTDYQGAMIQINIADDYFKAQRQASWLETKAAQLEKEIYSLKHELVGTQMKLEAARKEALDWQEEVEALEKKIKEKK